MPRRNDLHRILIVGSGPIVIGQACEFDYSGTQAAKALRADGFEVILVNSNPATIMTLRRHGITDVVLSCSYLVDEVRRTMGDGAAHGVRLSYAVETDPSFRFGSRRPPPSP